MNLIYFEDAQLLEIECKDLIEAPNKKMNDELGGLAGLLSGGEFDGLLKLLDQA